MKRYRVEFDVDVPNSVSDDEVTEWVRFNLHVDSMLASNPLSNRDLDGRAVVVRPMGTV